MALLIDRLQDCVRREARQLSALRKLLMFLITTERYLDEWMIRMIWSRKMAFVLRAGVVGFVAARTEYRAGEPAS